MINNFRNKGKDVLIVFGLMWVVTLPLIIIIMDRFQSTIGKIAVIACITLYNGVLGLIITTVLYINYIADLDNGIKINEFKILNRCMYILLICMYCVMIYSLIVKPNNFNNPFSSFFLFPTLLTNNFSRPTIVIGDTYITNSYQTVRIDSIISVKQGGNKSLNGVSRISLVLRDNKRIKILGSDKVYKLICERVKNMGNYE